MKMRPAGSPRAEGVRSRTPGRVHLVIQDVSRDELELAGIRVVAPLPAGGWVVTAGEDDLPAASALPAADKLSPVLPASGSSFLVEFHPDVDGGEARGIVLESGLSLRENPDLRAGHLLVDGTLEQVRDLARWDEVAYIFPASEDLIERRPAVPCAGAATAEGNYGQYIARSGEGWDGAGLGQARLGYAFGTSSAKLDPAAARAEVARAFAEWSKFVKVTFTPASQADGTRTVKVLFATKSHGDPYAFDGPRGALAHTFYPSPPNPEPIAGDMHFDDDEAWHIGADLDLYSVALHETGHALGLGHSDSPSDIMYPYYRRLATLSAGDIAAIRTMYAASDGSTASPGTPGDPPPGPEPPQNPTDTTAPSITVTSPSTNVVTVSTSTIVVKGTARDNVGVARVTWTLGTGSSGTASGTTAWTTAAIPLVVGSNTITLRAYDAAGNSSWRSLVVTRK